MPSIVPRPQSSVEWMNKGKNEWEKTVDLVLLQAVRKAENVSCDHKEHHANHMELNKHRATLCWKGQPCWEGAERAAALPELTGAGRMSVDEEELLENDDCNKITNVVAAAATAKSLQLCLTLCNPIDGSPLGSSVPGILQARILEWVAISFSHAWKWKVKVKSLSHARLLATPWTGAYQVPPSMGFSMQEYWSGVPLPSPTNVVTKCQREEREGGCSEFIRQEVFIGTYTFWQKLTIRAWYKGRADLPSFIG